MPVLFFCLPSYIIIAECCPGTGAGTEAEEMKTAQDKTYEALYYSLWENWLSVTADLHSSG